MYQIDCQHIESFQDLINAFNRDFIEQVGGKWNGNLDALNDYLSWPEQCPYEMVILGQAQCAKVLDFRASDRHKKNLWSLIQEILLDNPEYVHVEFR